MADARFTPSSFGGGWLVPLSEEFLETYTRAFEEEPVPLEPLNGEVGWIVEPAALYDLLADIRCDGFELLLA